MTKPINDKAESTDCRIAENCPIRRTLQLLEGKHTMLILRELLSGKKRFSDFLKSIKGISSKTLSDRLKHLADGGIVSRHAYPEIPPKVEYTLTQKGHDLEGIILSMERFGKASAEHTEGIRSGT